MDQEPAAIAVPWNSCLERSSGVDKVHQLARAFGRAKSQAHRDDVEARRVGLELCHALQIMRSSAGYTRHELANECDIPLAVVREIEEGVIIPSISVLNRAFSFLGVEVLGDILDGSI